MTGVHLQPGLVEGLDQQDQLLAAVQCAIELEHSTLPPYLYALWSLTGPGNQEVASLIQSVTGEEMLHMALACNLLNALGGAPAIDTPEFVPTYPGHLPCTVEASLEVPLEPFSPDLVKRVFMVIEQPEDPLEFPDTLAAGDVLTIGMFYGKIREQMQGATFTPHRNQVTHPLMPELHEINDADSACSAIDLIVEQGEGTSTSPLDLEGDYAHYYRFAEIVHGRRLVKNPDAGPATPPDQQYAYTGDPISWDPEGVIALVSNPTPNMYAGTRAEQTAANFDYTYTSMLRCLHDTFNGAPGQLVAAFGLMQSMKQQAVDLMAVELPSGGFAGPMFRYRPTNP
jgi:hypothetical protein